MSDSRDGERVLSTPARAALPRDAAAEVAALLRTLEQDNVRRLSVTLLIDLLALETDRARAAELVREASVLGEDRLLAGDYDAARDVVRALARHAADRRRVASHAARAALEGLVTRVASHEAADGAGEMNRRAAAVFAELSRWIRPSSIAAVLPARVPSAVRARRAS